jgi:tRNA A-37 threonylcarbamoyl transferase component Bud32
VQQSKWIIAGLMAALVGFIIETIPPLVIPALSQPTLTAIAYDAGSALLLRIALSLVPIAIGFSIHSYRLWDVDFVLNRGVVYGALTVFLLLFALFDILLVQRIVQAVTGSPNSPVVLTTAALVLGLSFQPSRRWLQHQVDSRMFGINVHYGKSSQAKESIVAGSLVGMQLGQYEVLKRLGRGGMAEVYLGFHPMLNRNVAIKMLQSHRADEVAFRKRFEREAQTIAALKHPNVVQLYDFGEMQGIHYMVMEYIPGQELGDLIRQEGALPLEQVRAYVRDIASALDYAHSADVVHRDVKASNVMLQPVTSLGPDEATHRAVLMDFGIVKIRGDATKITRAGLMGTLDYIAPEQIKASSEVDGRADVYSLGVMTYQMLTGDLPFEHSNAAALLIAHLQHPPPDPRTLRPNLPDQIAEAVMRAMAKEPGDRFQTAGELARALA